MRKHELKLEVLEARIAPFSVSAGVSRSESATAGGYYVSASTSNTVSAGYSHGNLTANASSSDSFDPGNSE